MDKEKNDQNTITMDDFYDKIQKISCFWNNIHNLSHVTSRSTDENLNVIQNVSSEIKNILNSCLEQLKSISSEETDLRIKIFKYLICNTNFESHLLLAEDTANGYLVDIQPPFSPYLFIEILWNICYEDILAESILYLPLDLCLDILEILPRCIDLLNIQRTSMFLATLIPNIYEKLIIMRDIGSQTEDIISSCKKLATALQELILQFTNKRFMQLEDMSETNRYKIYGTLLKTIIKTVNTCLTSKFKKIEFKCERKKMYSLTFGWKTFIKLNDSSLKEFLMEIDHELISLLLKKLKEIDCNIYLNWSEYNDEENISLTLQQAVGFECHLFIKNTKHLDYSNIQEFNHLLECLKQFASVPKLVSKDEHLQADLLNKTSYEKLDDLINLFELNKDFDADLLTKDICVDLIDYFAEKFDCDKEQSHLEILQTNLILFIKNVFHLNITELFEVAIKYILKFSENEKIHKIMNVTKIENFIIHNSNFSNSKNLKAILFFLCMKTKHILKILIKILIGHSNYADIAISLDDLMLLLPLLKIRTFSKYKSIMVDLRKSCCEKKEKDFYTQYYTSYEKKKHTKDKPDTVSLIVQILQEICLETSDWKTNKLINLLNMLYSFCTTSEIVKEIFIPLLMSCTHSNSFLKCTLLYKLYQLTSSHKFIIDTELTFMINNLAIHLMHVNHISKYVINDMITLILELDKTLCETYKTNDNVRFNDYAIFIGLNNIKSDKVNLIQMVGMCMSLLQNKFVYFNKHCVIHVLNDSILRYLFLKCTKKQYIKYMNEVVVSYGKFFKWRSIPEIYDNIIRLTFETCLVCLEFPSVCTLDQISFLISCLVNFLKIKTKKENNKYYETICKSLNMQILIFKTSIEYTAIVDSYSELLNDFNKCNTNLEMYLNALERFSFNCKKKTEKLKTFNGSYSPIAIKFWIENNIITMCLNTVEIKSNDCYNNKIGDYFNIM